MNGNKLSALVDQNGRPVACTVAPANILDSLLYKSTVGAFEIPERSEKPGIITADASYDTHAIRQYNRNRGIKSNIPINPIKRKYPKRDRPIQYDKNLYKSRGAIKRVFSWIAAFKKIVP